MKRWRYWGKRNKKDSFDLTIMVEVPGVDGVDRGTPLKHIERHSPTGMEWGYMGSGPSDLALSILVDYILRCRKALGKECTEEEAIRLADRQYMYMQFRDKVIAVADRKQFSISFDDIRTFIRENWMLTGGRNG
jgi:hypothetical protein